MIKTTHKCFTLINHFTFIMNLTRYLFKALKSVCLFGLSVIAATPVKVKGQFKNVLRVYVCVPTAKIGRFQKNGNGFVQ